MPHPIHTIAALAAALVVQAAAGADVIGGATDIRPVITTTGNPADLWDLQDVKGSPFAYDFDDGTAATDTIGTILGGPSSVPAVPRC